MASVDSETPVDLFECEVCHQEFDSRDEVVQHWRDNHSAAARKARGESPPQSAGARRSSTKTRRAPKKDNKPIPEISGVQTGLTVCYAMSGQVMGMWARAHNDPRAGAVATSIMMTAAPAGKSLDSLARRTPVYKFLNGFFGAAGVLEDATPLGIPLIVAMYAYAPAPAQEHLRPMAATMLGMLIYQTFGPDEPTGPGDMTPIALPKWIQEFAEGMLPAPAPQPVKEEAPAA